MITDIECRSKIDRLNTSKLKPYWNDYFSFQQGAPDLHELTAAALRTALDHARAQPRPFLDAQREIFEILNKLGQKHNFHRQFNERFGTMKPAQVLGMQLYALVVADSDWWVYMPTQHADHAFPHATYFMPRNDALYIRLVERNARPA